MKEVSRFEWRLLHILQFLLRRDPSGRALQLIYDNFEAPPCLSRTAVELIQDTLTKGCISILAKAHGWKTCRHIKRGRVVEGRLWERHTREELALQFSEQTMKFLIWITAANPSETSPRPSWPTFRPRDLTVGDLVFLYTSFGCLRGTEAERFFSSKDLFTTHGLCRLAFPECFADTPATKVFDFSVWAKSVGACVFESLQSELTERWIEVEKSKRAIVDWKRMQSLGRSQEDALAALFEALDEAKRWDLARFLFPALHTLLPDNPRMEWWTDGLQSTGPRLEDRTETLRAALVLPRFMRKLKEWETRARSIGYFDEDYAASQLWKSDWEHWQGDQLSVRAQALLEQIEPL